MLSGAACTVHVTIGRQFLLAESFAHRCLADVVWLSGVIHGMNCLTCLKVGNGRVVAEVPEVPNFARINVQKAHCRCRVHGMASMSPDCSRGPV